MKNKNHVILLTEYNLWKRCLKNLKNKTNNALEAM